MKYVPLDNISMKNECTCSISKRNIDQTAANGDEYFELSNKRSCVVEEVKLHPKDSIQSLKIHTNTESITHIRTHRLKPMPIIFHYASDDIMDIQKCGSDNMVTELNSIYSVGDLPTVSVHDFHRIPMKKSSQSDINRDNTSFQSEAIASNLIDSTFINNSSLSTSDTSLNRSLERLPANYREYLASREAETKLNIYQQQSTIVDTQPYIRCQKHRQPIPVEIIASDSEAKICQFTQSNSLSKTVSNNALLKTYRNKHKQCRKKSFICDLSFGNKS